MLSREERRAILREERFLRVMLVVTPVQTFGLLALLMFRNNLQDNVGMWVIIVLLTVLSYLIASGRT
jgi:hypothetical protein